jgi:hypothetical protein
MEELQLSSTELGLLELALSETIVALHNRFVEEIDFVHPAHKYERLFDKLRTWLDAQKGDISVSLVSKKNQ